MEAMRFHSARLIVGGISLVLAGCGGSQSGGGAVVGYCASYDYVDAMFGEPAHIEFCSVNEGDCRASAEQFAKYHAMEMECVPSTVMHCYGYQDTTYGGPKCSITAEECEKARAADVSDDVDPVLAELGAEPVATTPCVRHGS
jgi:hypothetical protein